MEKKYAKIDDIEKCLKNMSKNELCVISCAVDKNRKKIHQYIEKNYKIGKVSLCCSKFESNVVTFVKCPDCDKYTKVKREDYNYGFMDNNKDESYSMTCCKCDFWWSWEPNYDDEDEVFYCTRNNVVVLGDYLKFPIPKHAEKGDVEKEEFVKIIKDSNVKVYLITCPSNTYFGEKEVAKYIDDQF